MTSQHLTGAAAVALLALSLCACAKPAVDAAKITDAVKADVAQQIVDYNAHDGVKVASHGAPGGVAMFHGAPNTPEGPGAKPAPIDPSIKVTLANETVDVAAAGDMAVFHATYLVNVTDPATKKPVTENGNYLVGYKAQPDGAWKQTWSVVVNTTP